MYRYALDCDVAESLFSLPAKQRERFVKIFHNLANEPYQAGEYFFMDSVGREIQKKRFAEWWISYWADHAAKEMRIVGVQKAQRPA
jgi:hypothetical protein